MGAQAGRRRARPGLTMATNGGAPADGWRAAAEQGARTWAEAGTQLAQTVAQSMLAGQAAMGRVIELTSDAWKQMAPGADGAGGAAVNWQALFEDYANQVRQFVLGLPTSPATAGDMVQLWQLYVQQVQELSQPWLRLLTRDAPAHIGRAFPGEHSELLELSSHYWDAYERTIGRLLGSPSLGYSRELNHRLAEGFDAWQEFLRAGYEYRVVMSEAWMSAAKQTIAELGARAQHDKPVTSVKALIEVWTDTADKAFTEVFESQRYIDSQARMLNCAMALRQRQQQIVDDLMKGSFIPSRGDVDEAYRSIYELRKEIRALKQKVRELESKPPVASAPTQRAPRRARAGRTTSTRAPKRRSR